MPHTMKTGLLGLFAALAITATPAVAMNDRSAGYVYDDNGQIVRDAAGDCARTVFWTFSNALAECDPDAVLEALERTTTDKAAADVNLVTRFRTVTETLQGGQEFKFDDDSLSRSAMAKLDRIGLLHGRVLLKQVSVFGHTDRLGDENYNKDLSRRRAEAAKLYLMKVGIPEDIISVIPVGSEDPVARCEGMTGDRLKYCLAPNRRVEVRYTVPFIEGGLVADLVEKRSTTTETGIKATRQYFDVTTELNRLFRNAGNSCRTEIKDLCPTVEAGGGKLAACLYQDYAKLSGGCKTDLGAVQQYIRGTIRKVKTLANACATDMAVTCDDVEFGSGGMLACLVERSADVDGQCRDVMASYDLLN